MQVSATTQPAGSTEADTIALGVFEGERAPEQAPAELAELLASGEARRQLQVARPGARRRQALAARRTRASASASRPSGRAWPPPPRASARASWPPWRCAGRHRPTARPRSRARSSRARCSPTTASSDTSPLQSRIRPLAPKRLERLILSAAGGPERDGRRGGAGRRRRQRRARPAEPPRQRPDAQRAGRLRRGARRRDRRAQRRGRGARGHPRPRDGRLRRGRPGLRRRSPR